MRVLHVPFCYYPDPIGGTEVYVESLTHFQRRSGIDAMVAAPGSENNTYSHAGHTVHRFKTAASLSLRELYGEGDPQAAEFFRDILERVRPDIVHLHAFTSG